MMILLLISLGKLKELKNYQHNLVAAILRPKIVVSTVEVEVIVVQLMINDLHRV